MASSPSTSRVASSWNLRAFSSWTARQAWVNSLAGIHAL
jgi:hypothetical protein